MASLHFFQIPEKGKAWGDSHSHATGLRSRDFCNTLAGSKVQDFHYSILVKLETQKGSGWKWELAMSVACHRMSLSMFYRRLFTRTRQVTCGICLEVVLKFPWMQLLFTFHQGILLLCRLTMDSVRSLLLIRWVLILFSAIPSHILILCFEKVRHLPVVTVWLLLQWLPVLNPLVTRGTFRKQLLAVAEFCSTTPTFKKYDAIIFLAVLWRPW